MSPSQLTWVRVNNVLWTLNRMSPQEVEMVFTYLLNKLIRKPKNFEQDVLDNPCIILGYN